MTKFKLKKLTTLIPLTLTLGITACSGTGSAPTAVSPTTPTTTTPTPSRESEYILGADISSYTEMLDKGVIFVDTDGNEKTLLELLKHHGFNSIRLRTFVDPSAPYGYASNNRCSGKLKGYNSKEDIVAFAQEVEQAGMSLLLD